MPYADKEKQREYCRNYQRNQREIFKKLREQGILDKLKEEGKL